MDLDAPLTIGYLSSYLSSKTALGAIPLAIETINADPNLLPGRTLQFVAADIGNPVGNDALAMLAIRRMTEMRDNNQTIAFIGPDGQCAAEALVAAAWNLPMITHVSIAIVIRCENSYTWMIFTALTWHRVPLVVGLVSSCAIFLLFPNSTERRAKSENLFYFQSCPKL